MREAEAQAWHRHMGFTEYGIITGINPGGVGELFLVKQSVATTLLGDLERAP